MPDKVKRERRSAEQLAQDHFDAKLNSMTFEEKIELVKILKTQITTEAVSRKVAAEEAHKLTEGL